MPDLSPAQQQALNDLMTKYGYAPPGGVLPPTMDPQYQIQSWDPTTGGTVAANQNPVQSTWTPQQTASFNDWMNFQNQNIAPRMNAGGFPDWIKPIAMFGGLAAGGGALANLGSNALVGTAGLEGAPMATGEAQAIGLTPGAGAITSGVDSYFNPTAVSASQTGDATLGSGLQLPPGSSTALTNMLGSPATGGTAASTVPDFTGSGTWSGPVDQYGQSVSSGINMPNALMYGLPAVGGITNALAASQAAKTMADAARAAGNNQLAMFYEQQANLAPWQKSGTQANQAIMSGLGFGGPTGSTGITPGQFTQPFQFSTTGPNADPSYQWRLNQGMDATLANAPSLGGSGGGNMLKALTNYAQGAASQEYGAQYGRWNDYINNLFNRLNTVSGSGLNAAGTTANLGMQAATNAGNANVGAANATAAGQVGVANALTGAGSQIANNWLINSILASRGAGALT